MANSNQRVTLVFDADTSKAKASVNELYTTLERLSSININNAPGKLLAKDIQEASLAATQLKISLENAVNVNTGKLDLNKFNSSLQQSKMSLQDYQRILTSCGPAGQQAFTQLARSVIAADASVIKLGDKVRALGVTLANTAKWQISSSAIHGITGAFSSAYNYAKDLNESLNNIRIVTGYSIESMKDFAAEANRAAQALSTTTTEYSNAALIFYQQGLSGNAVKERVDTVIKLANVTGQSASEVSNYMTAIWNNFYDGSQSLEHYADVLTKLGAATASSSDEIVGGLEKFAAIGDTIGLSYEYAASALATITAQTRQSEEVVGTALKTIFARIQGLNLGETLEDGVDLNKYSSALKTVGIDIFDTTGELKNMDIILQEMGETWGTLSKAQQTALAQTVAGVRQYNQLISLMDNWDDFEINLDMAINSDGSLEDQYAIYEESWEAASKRMKAASQDMYDSLINDEAFIKLTDFFTNFIQSISASIDSIGGLKGVLLLLGSVLMKVFSPQVGNFLDSIGLKIQNIATGTNKGLNNMKQQATQMLGESYSASGTFSGGVQAVAAENMGSVNQAYLAQAEKLGAFQKSIADSLLQQQNALNESVIKQGELVKSTEKEYEKRKATLSLSKESLQGGTKTSEGKVAYNKVSNKGADAIVKIAESANIDGVEKTQTKGEKKGKVLSTDINVADEETAIKLQTAALEEYTTKMAQAQAIKETFITPMAGLENETANLETLASSLEKFGASAELSKQDMEELNGIIQSSDFAIIESELDKGIQSFEALEATLQKQGKTMEQTFGKAGANAIKQYASQIKSAKSAQDTMRKSSEKIKELDEKIDKARTSAAKTKYEKERAEEQKKLTTATQQYNTAVQGSKTVMAGAGEAGKGLRAVFGEVDASMKQLNMDAATAKNALLALGYSESQLQALEQACEDMNVDFAQLVTLLAAAKGGAQNFEGQLNRLAASSQTVGQTLSKIGSVASQVAMGINAISGLGEIWTDEDLTVGEKFTSTLMNLAMILPLVGTAIDAVNKLKNINKINSLAAAGATEVEIATQMKQMGVTTAETEGLWGKAAAWIAAHPLLAGVGIAAAVAGIALMAIMTAHEKKQTQELEAQAKAAEKAADASREKAEASKEELNAIKDLHEEYDELYSEYRDSGEIKSDLITTTTDLVNKLGIEEGHLLILQGRYEELNALIKEHLKLKAQDNKDNANQALGDAADSAYNTLEAGKNDKVFINDKASEKGHEGQYVMGFWDVGANDAWFTDYLTSQYPNGPWEIVGDKVVAYYTNPNQIPYLQNQFDTVFQGALDSVGGAANLSEAQKNGSIYNEYQRGIVNGGNEDSSKAWQGVLDAGEEAYMADFEYELFDNEVDDATEYGKIREEWIQKMAGDNEDAQKYYSDLIDTWVQDTSFVDYANMYAATEAQWQNIGSNAGKYKTVDDIADQMEADGYDRDLALQVKIEPWMNEDDITNAINVAQDIADKNQITLTITAAEEGIKALEDVISVEDYEAWWTEYGEQALKDSGYDKNTFAALSPSKQREILEGQTELEVPSTTSGELDQARANSTALETERTQYINDHSEYFDDNGNFLYHDYQDPVSSWQGSFSNSRLTAEQLQWMEQVFSNKGIDFTQENILNFLNSYYNTSTTTGNRGEPQIARNNFAETYGIDFDTNKEMMSGIYQGVLGDQYKDAGARGVTAQNRDIWLNNSLTTMNNNGMFTDYETWSQKPDGITAAEAQEIESGYTNILIRQNANNSEISRLEQESAAEAQKDPYEKEMEYKEEISDLGLDVDEVYELKDALEDAAGTSKDFSEDLKGNEDALKEAAKQMSRYNKAVKDAEGKFGDWKDSLKGNDLQKQASAVKELSGVYADMFDLEADDFSDEFLRSTDNLELMEKALDGSEEAYNDLQTKVAMGIIEKHFKELPGITQEMIDEITSQKIRAGDLIEFDSEADGIGSQLFNMYSQAVEAAQLGGASVADAMAQANALMQAIGFEPPEVEMEEKEITLTGDIPDGWTPQKDGSVTTTDASGKTITVQGVRAVKTQGGTYKYKQTILVPKGGGKIAKSTENLGGSTINDISDKGKSKKVDPIKKSDVVERYKEINDQIEKLTDATNDASKAADRLYGASRIKQMEKQNKLIKDEIDLLKQKKDQALDYLEEDRQAVADAAKEAGVELNIDENGFISNYTQAMTELYKELDAAINSANADGNADEAETERIDAAQERIDELKSAMDQYDETRDMIKDLDNQLDEKFYEWQDNNYEQLTYKLELKLELNDSDLEVIDYELNKISDDFYKMAEAAALMIDSSSSSTSTSQLDIYTAELKSYEDQQIALNEAFEKGEISQSSYIEGLKEIKSGIYENLEAIQELDKSMMDYYGNTLDMAADEIAKYTDRMDHQVSVLDHYSSLLEIMGKQNDYKTMHKTLEAKAQIIGDQVAVAKDTLEMYQGQAEARFNEYQDALARGDEKAAELYLKQYEAALAAANEAQDVYLSKAEEWAEALKAVLENKLADIGKTLEEALTGGTSFDEISKQMERASSLQEEYLTTTNKIYETNKMINTAQQAIDKTDNLNAKRRLRSFQEETAQMQNKGKLSKFELEIQQAKYDLLLAEIALEEAQNAKSMVRLQRDSEGNFGYVYTADDQKVAEAEQNAMDKENALYNIRLEGANSYVEKYQQTMQEMYDELQDLTDRYHNGEIESFEEYQRLMTETQNHYYQKLEDYSELYGIAIQEDTRIIEDAWSTEFASMTEHTEEWKNNVDIYIREVSTAFDNYEKEMERIALETGTDVASMENSIKEVVDESKNLKDVLVGENGLISAINDQATAVANITSRYASLRDSLGLITAAYEASGKAASDAIIKQQKALQAINTTNTALKNQSGTVGEDGSLTGVGGEGPEDDGGGKGPEDLEPSLIEPPKDFEVTVIPRLSHPRETKSIRASRIIISDQPTSGSTDPNQMIRVIYNDGLMGNITRKDYDAIKQYQIDLEKYNKTIASMDTGGYTGSWGTEGKLAMLHQKELVLNADDTQNFLTSLDVLHEIIKMIDLQAINSRVGGFLQIPNMNFAPNEILDQQVHIEASFPGVTDRNEIEEAFKTLVNRASQFANRKNF